MWATIPCVPTPASVIYRPKCGPNNSEFSPSNWHTKRGYLTSSLSLPSSPARVEEDSTAEARAEYASEAEAQEATHPLEREDLECLEAKQQQSPRSGARSAEHLRRREHRRKVVDEGWARRLSSYGVQPEETCASLVQNHRREVRQQLKALPYRPQFKDESYNIGGLLIRAIHKKYKDMTERRASLLARHEQRQATVQAQAVAQQKQNQQAQREAEDQAALLHADEAIKYFETLPEPTKQALQEETRERAGARARYASLWKSALVATIEKYRSNPQAFLTTAYSNGAEKPKTQADEMGGSPALATGTQNSTGHGKRESEVPRPGGQGTVGRCTQILLGQISSGQTTLDELTVASIIQKMPILTPWQAADVYREVQRGLQCFAPVKSQTAPRPPAEDSHDLERAAAQPGAVLPAFSNHEGVGHLVQCCLNRARRDNRDPQSLSISDISQMAPKLSDDVVGVLAEKGSNRG